MIADSKLRIADCKSPLVATDGSEILRDFSVRAGLPSE